MRRFLLDTGILVHYIRKSSTYEQIESDHRLKEIDAMPLISVVTKAELLSVAIQWDWGSRKLSELNTLLNKVPVIDINSQDTNLIRAYAELDAYSKGKLTSKPLGRSAVIMSKNDLWIAATAVTANAVLITTDRDFDHLNNVFLKVVRY